MTDHPLSTPPSSAPELRVSVALASDLSKVAQWVAARALRVGDDRESLAVLANVQAFLCGKRDAPVYNVRDMLLNDPMCAAIAHHVRTSLAASHSPGTPAPAGGTLTACPRAVYYCMACPLTFPDAASSNAHHDATGHNQTWRPVMAFHARKSAATAASGIGTTEDADCFDGLTESAAVNDALASMARDYPGSVARVVRYLREVKADRDRMDWWEAHLPESIYWKDRGGNLKQGWTFRRFTDAARSSTENPQ